MDMRFGLLFVFLCVFVLSGNSGATTFDIYPNHKIDLNHNQVSYSPVIDDCQNLSRVEYQNEVGKFALTSADSQSNPNSLSGCKFVIGANTPTKFSSTFAIHSETFTLDTVKPNLTFGDVSISEEDSKQYLTTTLTVKEIQDIHYVVSNIVGMKASNLTNADGVIEKAKMNVFVQLNDVI